MVKIINPKEPIEISQELADYIDELYGDNLSLDYTMDLYRDDDNIENIDNELERLTVANESDTLAYLLLTGNYIVREEERGRKMNDGTEFISKEITEPQEKKINVYEVELHLVNSNLSRTIKVRKSILELLNNAWTNNSSHVVIDLVGNESTAIDLRNILSYSVKEVKE